VARRATGCGRRGAYLDDQRRWYRYHHLFADFLGQRLHEQEPERIPELHRRASQWYEAAGSADDAIEHALAAGDTVRAYVTNQVGDLARALDLSQQALEQMADAPPEQVTLVHRGAVVIWLAVNYRHLGNLDRAPELFVEASSLNRQAGNYYAALASKQQLGELAMVQGQLHRAAEALPLLDRLLRAAQSMGRWGDALRYLLQQAVAFYALGDVPSALASLAQALPPGRTGRLCAPLCGRRPADERSVAGHPPKAAAALLDKRRLSP
jgi:ATP/maltotriose-dependent transcriptional regulator MalT